MAVARSSSISSSSIRVHLVDEDLYSRSAITAQLSEASDLVLETCFNTVEESLAQKDFSPPDVLLINILRSDLLADHRLGEAVLTLPEVKIILLTMNPSMEVLEDAYESGIAGVLSKRMASTELSTYIRVVVEGHWLFIRPENSRPRISSPLREGLYKRYLRNLDADEQQIVRYVALGLTNSQIAHKVHQSEGTVKKRLFNILAELGLSKRVHLTLLACDAKIVGAKDLISTLPD